MLMCNVLAVALDTVVVIPGKEVTMLVGLFCPAADGVQAGSDVTKSVRPDGSDTKVVPTGSVVKGFVGSVVSGGKIDFKGPEVNVSI